MQLPRTAAGAWRRSQQLGRGSVRLGGPAVPWSRSAAAQAVAASPGKTTSSRAAGKRPAFRAAACAISRPVVVPSAMGSVSRPGGNLGDPHLPATVVPRTRLPGPAQWQRPGGHQWWVPSSLLPYLAIGLSSTVFPCRQPSRILAPGCPSQFLLNGGVLLPPPPPPIAVPLFFTQKPSTHPPTNFLHLAPYSPWICPADTAHHQPIIPSRPLRARTANMTSLRCEAQSHSVPRKTAVTPLPPTPRSPSCGFAEDPLSLTDSRHRPFDFRRLRHM